jgi:hypothetical protein
VLCSLAIFSRRRSALSCPELRLDVLYRWAITLERGGLRTSEYPVGGLGIRLCPPTGRGVRASAFGTPAGRRSCCTIDVTNLERRRQPVTHHVYTTSDRYPDLTTVRSACCLVPTSAPVAHRAPAHRHVRLRHHPADGIGIVARSNSRDSRSNHTPARASGSRSARRSRPRSVQPTGDGPLGPFPIWANGIYPVLENQTYFNCQCSCF